MTQNEKQQVIGSMEAITIRVFLRSDGDYDYQVWPCDMDEAQQLENEGDSTGEDNGGVCTGNMGDALDMARDAALTVVRAHFSDNCFNNDVCPSSLDENGEPATDGETDHKWNDELEKNDDGEMVIKCNECGAEKDNDIHHD